MIRHLIDVGVPHLGEEPEGRWGVWVVNRELDPSLGHTTGLYMWLCTVLLQFTIWHILLTDLIDAVMQVVQQTAYCVLYFII